MPLSGLVSWWRAEHDAGDAKDGKHGLLRIGADSAAGPVGQAFDFNSSNHFVEVPNSASLNPGASFPIEGWILHRQDRVQVILGKWGYTGDTPEQCSYIFYTGLGGALGLSISDAANQTNGAFHLFNTTSNVLTLNVWNHVAAVCDQTTGTRRLYVNGTKAAERADTPITVLKSTEKVGIGTWFPSSTTTADHFDGLIDELSFSSRALGQSEIQTIYNAGASGKCLVPVLPAIIAQPRSTNAVLGAAAAFAVTATGSTPLSYQWQLFGISLPQATNSLLTLTNVRLIDAGDYRVVITNEAGAITSAVATLTVLQPPVIVGQPKSIAAAPGGSATFSVSVSGLTPFAYQWQREGIPLAGHTNASLTISPVQLADFGSYTVGITNADGSIVSDAALLILAASPVVRPGSLNLSTFTLTIPTEVRPIYVLEYKDSLDKSAWKVLTSVVGTGSPIPITDNGLTNSSIFYRVQVR